MSTRRSVASFGALLGATLVVSGVTAFACTNLATLNLSTGSGKAGDVVTVTGSSFRMPTGVTTGVVLRWNGVDGPVLGEVLPDRVGNISARFTVPNAPPDNYVVLAMLRDARGADTSGTPARAQFQIVGGTGTAVPAPAAAQVVSGGGSSSSSAVPLALTIVLGVAGMALFGAGLAAAARQRRSASPVPAPVRHD